MYYGRIKLYNNDEQLSFNIIVHVLVKLISECAMKSMHNFIFQLYSISKSDVSKSEAPPANINASLLRCYAIQRALIGGKGGLGAVGEREGFQ